MKKYIFKHVMKKAFDELNAVEYGYEMDCLINAEFAPAPDYNLDEFLTKELEKYGYTLGDFVLWVEKQAVKWEENYPTHGYDRNPYVDLLFNIPKQEADCLSVDEQGGIHVHKI